MTTDLEQIRNAISDITGRPSYIALMKDDFDSVTPEGMVHVCGDSADEVLEALAGEYAKLQAELSGVLLFVRSGILTMNDLGRITKGVPHCPFYKAGLSFDKPEGRAVEVFVFYSRKAG